MKRETTYRLLCFSIVAALLFLAERSAAEVILTGATVVTSDPNLQFETNVSLPVTSTVLPLTIDDDECGLTKGCYRAPANCRFPGCSAILTWRSKGEHVEFEYGITVDISQSQAPPWAAFGISNNGAMNNASVVDCIVGADNELRIQASFNSIYGPENNVLEPNNQLGLVPNSFASSLVDALLICKFHRYLNVNQSDLNSDKVFDLNGSHFFLLLANGLTQGGIKQEHSTLPLVSRMPVSFLEMVDIQGESEENRDLVKAHASMMVISWMIFASIGMIVSRHFKLTWKTNWLGTALWFQVHRVCMVTTFLMTVIAFVLISIHVGGIEVTIIHHALGISVLVLVILNPIMALFRPKPDSRFRVFFNWCHRIVGVTSHVLAAVAIFYGVLLKESGVSNNHKWIVVIFICWTLFFEILLFMFRCRCGVVENYEVVSSSATCERRLKHGGLAKSAVVAGYLAGVILLVATLVQAIVTT